MEIQALQNCNELLPLSVMSGLGHRQHDITSMNCKETTAAYVIGKDIVVVTEHTLGTLIIFGNSFKRRSKQTPFLNCRQPGMQDLVTLLGKSPELA